MSATNKGIDGDGQYRMNRKNKIIAILSSTLVCAVVVIANSKGTRLAHDLVFEDKAFEYCVTASNNTNPTTRAKDVLSLECDGRYISTIAGIEQLPNLQKLNLRANKLASVDLSGNPELTVLYIHGNALTVLDVSANTKLRTLFASENELESLDISNNTALTYLEISNNKLTELNLVKNTVLTQLYASGNALTALNLSANSVLRLIDVDDNQLKSLDVSKNNALTTLSVNNNQLTSIDLSKSDNFVSLQAKSNRLSTILFPDLSRTEHTDIRDNPFNSETREYLKTVEMVIPTRRWPYETHFSFQWDTYSLTW